MYVYQLLTEPGEKSTIFTVFGSYADQRHSWLILQVNASDVLGEWTLMISLRWAEVMASMLSLVLLRLFVFHFHNANEKHTSIDTESH